MAACVSVCSHFRQIGTGVQRRRARSDPISQAVAMSGTHASSVQWAKSELPNKCYHRELCDKPGNIPDGQLPIVIEKKKICETMPAHQIFGLNSQTASGKTTQMPAFVYKVLRDLSPEANGNGGMSASSTAIVARTISGMSASSTTIAARTITSETGSVRT